MSTILGIVFACAILELIAYTLFWPPYMNLCARFTLKTQGHDVVDLRGRVAQTAARGEAAGVAWRVVGSTLWLRHGFRTTTNNVFVARVPGPQEPESVPSWGFPFIGSLGVFVALSSVFMIAGVADGSIDRHGLVGIGGLVATTAGCGAAFIGLIARYHAERALEEWVEGVDAGADEAPP